MRCREIPPLFRHVDMKTIPSFSCPTPIELFLDLDGVFAHFDLGVYKLSGKWPHELPKSRMWQVIHRNKDFFLTLELMPEANVLWDYCKQYDRKTFLTGAPSSKLFQEHKPLWVRENLCRTTPVIVLPSKNKQLHAGPNKMLVDDRDDMIQAWIAKGGIGILHKGDVWETIEKMEAGRLAARA